MSDVVGLLINYRNSQLTIECVESLLAQPVCHVLVWDNSADGGVSAVEIDAHFAGDPRVTIVVHGRNAGFAAAVNAGVERCLLLRPGAWMLLINNDARLLPGGLSQLQGALLENTAAKIAFPTISHAGVEVGPAFYHYWTGAISWRPRRGSFRYASGCCLLVAPERLQLPLFDEDFFMYGEDCALGWRLRNEPAALVHVPEILVEHRGSASSGLGSPFYEERMVAAHWLLAGKLAGAGLSRRWLLFCARALMLSARAVVRAVRFRSIVPFVALWRGWRIAFIGDPLRAVP